jgi:YegS/Rv2252/BmrU family lipid kinase
MATTVTTSTTPTSPSSVTGRASRTWSLDPTRLERPAALIFNPNAGAKVGISTNSADLGTVQRALTAAGIRFEPRPTERAGHATELARAAVAEGRQLVIAAGGDGTVGEVAQALVGTTAVLGVMPLGSIMNVARTLCIPRDLDEAARAIAAGRVLAMDVGKHAEADVPPGQHRRMRMATRKSETYFLEAAGAGLDAGLFGYFNQLDRGRGVRGVARGLLRFLKNLGSPRLVIEADGRRLEARAPMVTIANSPFVGAAYAIAPDARIDDGLLDVVVFRGLGVARVLLHLALVAGGRQLPPPPQAQTLRVTSLHVTTRRRTLPVHVDGVPIGGTPARFEVVPAALNVLVGTPGEDGSRAWACPAAA